MRRRLLTIGVAASLLVAAGPASAVPDGNPGGCKENGQAVAGAAQAPGPFGQFVKTNVPINDEVELFKTIFCGP
jgi:hypothetical protein